MKKLCKASIFMLAFLLVTALYGCESGDPEQEEYIIVLKGEDGQECELELGMPMEDAIHKMEEADMPLKDVSSPFERIYVNNLYSMCSSDGLLTLSIIRVETDLMEAPLGLKVGDKGKTMLELYGEPISITDELEEERRHYLYVFGKYSFEFSVFQDTMDDNENPIAFWVIYSTE